MSSFRNIALLWEHLKMQSDILVGFKAHVVAGVSSAGRCDTVLSPLTVCSSTMAAVGPEDRAGAGPGGMAVFPSGLQACVSTTTQNSNGPGRQQTLVSKRRATGIRFRVAEMRDHLILFCLSSDPQSAPSPSMHPFSRPGSLDEHV